jgi:hypothetical protein
VTVASHQSRVERLAWKKFYRFDFGFSEGEMGDCGGRNGKMMQKNEKRSEGEVESDGKAGPQCTIALTVCPEWCLDSMFLTTARHKA